VTEDRDMRILVAYDTTFGNTERIARAIADALAEAGAVEARPIGEVQAPDIEAVDLFVAGGPTQRHGASPALVAWLQELARSDLSRTRAAVFDTRYPMAKLWSGSAADAIARWLRRAGCTLVGPPESFFVETDAPEPGEGRRHDLARLQLGEAERAAVWARRLVNST
jgi:flavodoxin